MLLAAVTLAAGASAQSPRTANPDRPTFATHAYAVAPGYLEIEQGLRAQGTNNLSGQTAWDVNMKIGVAPWLQLGVFGPALVHTQGAAGCGDIGLAFKLRGDLSSHVAVAIEPSVTLPTGNADRGRGAGQTLGGVIGVFSADPSSRVHLDINLGPTSLGAGSPPWFHSIAGAWALGRWGLTGELYGYTAGAGSDAMWGLLAAADLRWVEWGVLDFGGSVGTAGDARRLVSMGVTTNVGRIFK